MSNVLSDEKRLRVLVALVDGNSVRAVERMTEVHQRTVSKFALALGEGSQRLHDRLVRDLACPLITVDEQWGFIRKKQSRVVPTDEPGAGDAWTWVGIDMNSRLVISFVVGRRDQESADVFMSDLRARLVVMPQITSDGLALYEQPIAKEFGPGVDYAQTIKNYRKGSQRGPDHRYEPPREPFITKRAVLGAPDMKKASTAYVERSNLNVRHMNGRMRRLCLAFSKRLDHHRAAMALTYTYGNFCRVIRTLRVTAAMQAGITDHVWTASEFMATVLAEHLAARPEKKPLVSRTPEGPARQLATGNWLRLVTGHKIAKPGPAPTPPAPIAPAQASPNPRVPVQGNLFGEPDELA